MATHVDYGIAMPIMQTLSHFALTKLAVTLWNDHGRQALDAAFVDITNGTSEELLEKNENPKTHTWIRAQKTLLLVPVLLRTKVLEAVHGLDNEVWQWKRDHKVICNLKPGELFLHWRSDGFIDKVKTARQLLLNENIDIRKRFELACMYSFEDSIYTLWAEMEAQGKTEHFRTRPYSMARFWVGRTRSNSSAPWIHAAVKYLESPSRGFLVPILSCRTFFPLLQPKDRKRFIFFLQFGKLDDFLFSLFALTEEEKEKILREYVVEVLSLYFEWPLRDVFLEAVEKLWIYMDETSFCLLLDHILSGMPKWMRFEEFECRILFEKLWNMSPPHLKEKVMQSSYMCENIDWCLSELRKESKE